MKLRVIKIIIFVIPFLLSNDISGQHMKIDLTHFELTDIPDTFYGCSCMFSSSKQEYQAGQYLYFDDLGDNCLISINNKIIVLEGDGEKYNNDEFSVYLFNRTQVDEGYESSVLTAELIIEDKQGNEQTYRVYGICGC